jgi:hypothetical protein
MKINASDLDSCFSLPRVGYASCENRALLAALFRAVITRQSSSVIKTLAGCGRVTLRRDQDLFVPGGHLVQAGASRSAFGEVIYASRAAIIKRPFSEIVSARRPFAKPGPSKK